MSVLSYHMQLRPQVIVIDRRMMDAALSGTGCLDSKNSRSSSEFELVLHHVPCSSYVTWKHATGAEQYYNKMVLTHTFSHNHIDRFAIFDLIYIIITIIIVIIQEFIVRTSQNMSRRETV
jgi:hypothetical protein